MILTENILDKLEELWVVNLQPTHPENWNIQRPPTEVVLVSKSIWLSGCQRHLSMILGDRGDVGWVGVISKCRTIRLRHSSNIGVCCVLCWWVVSVSLSFLASSAFVAVFPASDILLSTVIVPSKSSADTSSTPVPAYAQRLSESQKQAQCEMASVCAADAHWSYAARVPYCNTIFYWNVPETTEHRYPPLNPLLSHSSSLVMGGAGEGGCRERD